MLSIFFYKSVLWIIMNTNKTKNSMTCMVSCCMGAGVEITPIINILHFSDLKNKKKDWVKLNLGKCQCEWGESGGGFVWCCRGSNGQGSGLLAAPLALYRPAEELLDVPRHVHGVVQVKVSVRVQHWVTPVTDREWSHTALRRAYRTRYQHINQQEHSECDPSCCHRSSYNKTKGFWFGQKSYVDWCMRQILIL